MSSRPEGMGDQRHIAAKLLVLRLSGALATSISDTDVDGYAVIKNMINSKIHGRYDAEVEREVLGWFKQLLGVDIAPGMREVEKTLRDGQLLVKLAQVVQQRTPNKPPQAGKMKLKPNTMSTAFKQMENIEVFVKFCMAYGLHKNSCFQTVDLYEGRNMAQVLSTIQQLGSECQRHGFEGPVIGSKPTEKHIVEFTEEQLRAGNAIIGLQAGTNKCASQSGMAMGGARHIADIKTEEMSKEGQSIIGLQMGTNKGASQSGMSSGGQRHVADIKLTEMSKDSHSMIGLQAGSNKGASQKGMSSGGPRHVSDIKVDAASKESSSMIGLQMGSNKGASQAGMSSGGPRHVSDIHVENMSREGQSVIGLQAGSNKGASQSGMSMGGIRNISDSNVEAGDQGSIGLQMGSNKGASQSGMTMGGARHAADIRADNFSQSGQGVINLQSGTNQGASQAGMSMGKQRMVTD